MNKKGCNHRGTAHERTAPAGVENAEKGGLLYKMKVLCKQTFLTITVYIPSVLLFGVSAGEKSRGEGVFELNGCKLTSHCRLKPQTPHKLPHNSNLKLAKHNLHCRSEMSIGCG